MGDISGSSDPYIIATVNNEVRYRYDLLWHTLINASKKIITQFNIKKSYKTDYCINTLLIFYLWKIEQKLLLQIWIQCGMRNGG